jgi:dihydroorotase
VLHTHLVKPGLLPLETLLERMSAGPARIFGLDRPRVAAGSRANLVLLDLEREWTVGEQPFRSKSGNSWLLGSTLAGTVQMTLAGGAPVFEASTEFE